MTSDAVVTSESLHNKNCYAYLHLVHLPTSIRHTLPATMVEDLTHCRNTYRSRFAYADLYSAFYQYMDEHIQELYTAHPEATAELDRCVLSMFINDNHNLSRTFNAIKHIPLTHTTFKTDIEDSISYYISDGSVRINQAQSPADADTWCSRLYSILNNNYKPQYVTGLPSVRHYRANQGQPLTELRLGTQGQRHNGEPRVSPLFEAFLYAQARQNTNRNDVTHLYINNLNRDRTTYIGKKEKALTLKLEALEERHPNIAVITLPADSGIMDISAYKNTTPQHSYQNVKNDFLMIAMQDPRATQTFKDFYISPRIRALLFQDESGHYSQQTEIDKLNALLHKSFAAMAIPPSSQLSNATRQAVWFHCIKYELTHYIIETLSTGPHGVRNPLTVNFSCKDGIDRGGIASAYYHLIRSFELSSQPMNREEFDEALHAASTMVKARGMNYHLQVIWNAVNTYVNSHYERLQQHHEHKWLVTWRDENCPHVRIKELLKIRVQQLCSEVGQAANTNNPAPIQRALQILSLIQTQIDIDTSGKRLLLQAAVNTTELLHHPSTENLQRYTRLAEAIVVHYPTLKILSGLMKALVGAILYVLSLGIHKQTLSTGVSTFHSGWYAQEKYVLHSAMKSHLLLFSPARLVLHHPPVAENAWLETNDVNGIREMPVTQRSAL